mmetsp:Transcript_27349/g.65596  ORF Transcript_27349/g.65596 Transcript_27349/m.65596 type:complete len:91 (-) Transcript_27349:76-348(-)
MRDEATDDTAAVAGSDNRSTGDNPNMTCFCRRESFVAVVFEDEDTVCEGEGTTNPSTPAIIIMAKTATFNIADRNIVAFHEKFLLLYQDT